jgi:ribose transport system substrate-binding protein
MTGVRKAIRLAVPLGVAMAVVVPMATAVLSGAASASSSSNELKNATSAVQQEYKGTSRNVDSTSRAAAKGKTIAVISAGQAASSSAVPSNGAVEAAQAAGWHVTLYDAKLNPSNYAPLVRQAVAAHVNGIILVAIDCDTVRAPLQEARAAGIVVTGVYAFDCNDPHAGGSKQSLFSAVTNFGAKAQGNIDAFTESYGADQANYIISKSHNAAKIIAVQDPEFTVLYWTYKGFADAINASGGSKIVNTVQITQSDLVSGQCVNKIQSAVLAHPDATWIKSPYTYATTLCVVPALKNNSNPPKVMGGEGFHDEIDLIRQSKVTATNAISSTWSGWAAVDTMNSVFLHQKPVDSGIGWTIVDASHNMPAPGVDYTPPINFKAEYKKAWGVG